MKMLRGYAIAGMLGLAVLAASPARADLLVYADGTLEASDPTNTFVQWACQYPCTINGFNITSLQLTGVNGTGGDPLMDIGALDIATGSHGSVTLDLTQTDLTAGNAAVFLMGFSDAQTNLSVTRSFYLDTTNQGLLSTLLGTFTSSGSGAFQDALSKVEGLTGEFSITEEIVISSGSSGGSLSSDDDIAIPEPGSVSLFGVGLLALGAAVSRRRKPVTKI